MHKLSDMHKASEFLASEANLLKGWDAKLPV
jgi:hypothetical protein